VHQRSIEVRMLSFYYEREIGDTRKWEKEERRSEMKRKHGDDERNSAEEGKGTRITKY
jgi:hypothetical protein